MTGYDYFLVGFGRCFWNPKKLAFETTSSTPSLKPEKEDGGFKGKHC